MVRDKAKDLDEIVIPLKNNTARETCTSDNECLLIMVA
jgi:hypothetical protein